MDNPAETSSGDGDAIEQPMRFRVEHAPRVNFALQQNDVPVIRWLHHTPSGLMLSEVGKYRK